MRISYSREHHTYQAVGKSGHVVLRGGWTFFCVPLSRLCPRCRPRNIHLCSVYVYGSRLLRHMLVQPTKLEMACLLGREAFKKFQRTSRRLPVPPLRHNGRAASHAAAPWCGPRVVLPQAVLAVAVFGHLRCHRIRLRLGVLAFHIQGHRRISKPLAP